MIRARFALAVLIFLAPASAHQAESAAALYERALNLTMGTSVSRDPLAAIELLRRSAEQGYVPAQDLLGYLNATGKIARANHEDAAKWFRKAAEQGDRLAQWALGQIYFVGAAPSIPRDLNEAEKWLAKAADQKDPFATYLLGRLKEERYDYRAAEANYRFAAEQGLPQAQFRLGMLLRDARLGTPDKYHSYVWLLLAQQSHKPDNHVPGISLPENELTTEQLDRAKQEVRALQETTARTVVAHGCTGWHGEFDDPPSFPPPDLQKFCR